MTRIAIPIWENKVSPVFDTALKLLVVDFEKNGESSRLVYHIGDEDISWKCRRIETLAPDVIICGAVSQFYINILRASGIKIIKHISGRTEEVLDAYLKGDILNSRFLMPGSKRQRRGCGGRKKICSAVEKSNQ